MPKYWGKQIISLGSYPEVGQKKKTEKKKKRDRKLVITMASYALQRHHRWRTQAAWAKIILLKLLFTPIQLTCYKFVSVFS